MGLLKAVIFKYGVMENTVASRCLTDSETSKRHCCKVGVAAYALFDRRTYPIKLKASTLKV